MRGVRTRPFRPTAAAALVAVALLAGCQGEPPDVGATNGQPIGPHDEYVALGDSYTAAPFTGDKDSDDGCVRSDVNYPHLVAEELDLDLTDVSCGGATTDSLDTEQVTVEGSRRPPQLEALSEDTDLVTIGIGANDFNLFGSLVQQCVVVATQDPNGAPCTEADQKNGESEVEGRIDKIRTRLLFAIGQIADAAPNARVLVVGYPQFAPAAGTCEALPIAKGDYALARRFNELINLALVDAAAAADAEFVDVYTATEGHDICGEEPWIAGLEPRGDDAAPFHPYPEEQQAVADLIVRKLS